MSQHVDYSYRLQGDVKYKISSYTTEYQKLFTAEYAAFLKAHKPKINLVQTDNKHAVLQGGLEQTRQLGEYPETLFVILRRALADDEWKWFQSNKGQSWFFNTHPQYKLAGGKV